MQPGPGLFFRRLPGQMSGFDAVPSQMSGFDAARRAKMYQRSPGTKKRRLSARQAEIGSFEAARRGAAGAGHECFKHKGRTYEQLAGSDVHRKSAKRRYNEGHEKCTPRRRGIAAYDRVAAIDPRGSCEARGAAGTAANTTASIIGQNTPHTARLSRSWSGQQSARPRAVYSLTSRLIRKRRPNRSDHPNPTTGWGRTRHRSITTIMTTSVNTP